jgi:dTDP-D-glucose 4,6-dehydratase
MCLPTLYACARTLHGTGRNTRNFLYVEDVARAFDTILHKGLIGNIYNIGGTNEFSNLEVAKKLLALMGKVRAAAHLSLGEQTVRSHVGSASSQLLRSIEFWPVGLHWPARLHCRLSRC